MRSLLPFALLLLIACGTEKYPGFSEKKEGLYYQRLQLGEGSSYNKDSCFADYSVTFFDHGFKDSLIQMEYYFSQFPMEDAVSALLEGASSGEKVKIIVEAKNHPVDKWIAPEMKEDSIFHFSIEIDTVYNLFELEKDPNIKEYQEIMHFLNTDQKAEKFEYIQGVWFRNLSRSSSNEKLKDEIVLDYKGYSLQEKEWDLPDYPMQFNLNDRYQVIEGIEIALTRMSDLDSAEVIIPSYLAFGEEGSKNGNIPPFRPLHYYLKGYSFESYTKMSLDK